MYPSAERPDWGTFIESQVRSLRDLGVEIDVEVIHGYRDKLDYLRAMARVRRRCRDKAFDLVHAHYGLSGLVARAQLARPLVVSYCGDDLYGHSDASGKPTWGSLVWVFLGRLLSRVAAAVIVKSDDMASLLPHPPDAVIGNGVDMDVFRPTDRMAARRELGLNPDTRYVLFPYDPDNLRKNYAAIASAVALLNGNGNSAWEVLQVTGEPADRIPLYMNAADVLVLASFWEGSPNILKEAMACNMRIVSGRVGDAAQLIENVAGCRICDRNPESIADAVESVVDDPAEPASREAISHMALEKVAERVLAVYQNVASRKARG